MFCPNELCCPLCHMQSIRNLAHISLTVKSSSSNFLETCIALLWNMMTQSGHNFAHVMTAQLSWHVQNCDLIGSMQTKLKYKLNKKKFRKISVMSSWSVCEMWGSYIACLPYQLPVAKSTAHQMPIHVQKYSIVQVRNGESTVVLIHEITEKNTTENGILLTFACPRKTKLNVDKLSISCCMLPDSWSESVLSSYQIMSGLSC